MGDRMRFSPDLTFGYESELGAKPPRQLQLFLLFEEQLNDEEKSQAHVRGMEDSVCWRCCVDGIGCYFVAF